MKPKILTLLLKKDLYLIRKRFEGMRSRDMERIILVEEVIWKQKLMALWLREGEKSTKFFH